MLTVPNLTNIQEEVETFATGFNQLIGEERTKIYGGRFWDYYMAFKHGDFTPNDVVLDIGGGFSHFMVFLTQHIKQGIIVDNASWTWPVPTFWDWYKTLFDYDVFLAGKLSVVIQNAEELPFQNNWFDKVVSFSALEHFGKHNDSKAALEIRRVLKQGGYFLGTVDFNAYTELPAVEGNPYCYTYQSFLERVIRPSELILYGSSREVAGLADFNPDNNNQNYVSALFFKLVK